MRPIVVLGLSLLFITSTTVASWYEVSSDHFVIYANQSPKTIEKFADRLERFHDALNLWFGQRDTVPSPSNRLTVYVVGSERRVRKLRGKSSSRVAGFYMPRAGHSLTVVPKISNSRKTSSGSAFILYHEYAHHYQHLLVNYSFPRWLSEGLAEFFSSIKFEPNGDIGIGIPAYHRAAGLSFAEKIPIELLLDTVAYDEKRKKMPGWKYDSFYGQSWTLFHMLQFSKERKGQFGKYINALINGKSEIQAARFAFGELDLLAQDMDDYLEKPKLSYLPIPSARLESGSIHTRKLTKGEEAIIVKRIETRVGISRERAKELVEEIRPIGEKYTDNALVWETLAEVGVDAGYSQDALTWSERAIILNPESVHAKILKGQALEQLAKGESNNISWKQVRKQFVEANRQEPGNPVPLVKFYQSYLAEGITPTKNSVDGLIRALRLAPYDHDLRWMVAEQLVNESRYDAAIRVITPLANHPHNAVLAANAREFIEEVEAQIMLTIE